MKASEILTKANVQQLYERANLVAKVTRQHPNYEMAYHALQSAMALSQTQEASHD